MTDHVMLARSYSAYAELEAMITERAGMIAKNQERTDAGKSAAYDEIAFHKLSEQMWGIAHQLSEIAMG